MGHRFFSRNYSLIMLFGIGVLLFGLLFIVHKARKSIYKYDTDQSYDYSFLNRYSIIEKTELKDGKLILPEFIDENHTVIARVLVKSSFLGQIVQPSVEIIADSIRFVEYFEIGSKGYRYINLSSLAEYGRKKIEVVASKIEIEDQVLQLMIYHNPDLSNSKILIISYIPIPS